MHIPGDAHELEVGTSVEERLDWYFETATVAFELAVSACMRERGCDRAEAVRYLDEVWRRLDEAELAKLKSRWDSDW